MDVDASQQPVIQFQSNWDSLDIDLTELILSLLPIRSIVCAAAVCKLWRFLTSSRSFSARISTTKKPWFFLYGQNNIFAKNNQAFAFDPEDDQWLCLPTSLFPSSSHEQSFIGSGGFFITTTPCINARFAFAPVLTHSWRETSTLVYSRCNPLVGVFVDSLGMNRFIVVGGVRFIGGLVDIEDRLAVEIYDPRSDNWEVCPPLPSAFRSGNSSHSLSSALFKGKYYVFGIYSGFVSAFDLNRRCWSEVMMIRPPGVVSSFLITCGDRLVMAGLCNGAHGPSVMLWWIDERTLDFSEVAVMPQDLLYRLFDSEEDDRFASMKCVGLGNLIYVFNEQHHKCYPACVCEINLDSLKCSWRRMPPLPSPVSSFHKVISFCSSISLHNVLQRRIGF